MQKINELQLAKELIKFPTDNSSRCWSDEIFRKKIKKTWFQN